LISTFADLLAKLPVGDVLSKIHKRFLPRFCVQIIGIDQCAVEIENGCRHGAAPPFS